MDQNSKKISFVFKESNFTVHKTKNFPGPFIFEVGGGSDLPWVQYKRVGFRWGR